MSRDERQGDLFGKSTSPSAPRGRYGVSREGPTLRDQLPDARDGLTREQRIILYTLREAELERGGRNVPTVMLYGRVCERMSISQERFQQLLSQLVGRWVPNR